MKGVLYKACPLGGNYKQTNKQETITLFYFSVGGKLLLHPRVLDNHVSLSGMREA